MNAGRELDALVAEKVMGWTRTTDMAVVQWQDAEGNTRGLVSETLECDFCDRVEKPWSPSTDIFAAMEVMDKLPNHSLVRVKDGWLCTDKGSDFQYQDEDIEASTAPLVICLAALKVFGAL